MNKEFEFKILSPKSNDPNNQALYQQAYDTWNFVWQETFREIFKSDYVLHSNDFTRQNYIQALFMGDKCIALDLIREVDVRNPIDRDDSWLKIWNRSDLEKLTTDGHNKVLVNSYFTVHPQYRRSLGDKQINAGYLMGCLSVLHQLELGNSAMLGMMRNNRSMNTLGKMLGSSVVQENILHNLTPTDLVVFLDKDVKKASQDFPSYVFEIFQNKTNYHHGEDYARAA